MGVARRCRTWVTIVAAVLLLAGSAVAGTVRFAHDTKDGDANGDAYSFGDGGEFKVTEFTGGSFAPTGPGVALNSFFQTFCLERSEHIGLGIQYNWSISEVAVLGGDGGSVDLDGDLIPDGDPISAETAYLFNAFWRGTLSSYNYTLGATNRAASARDLQRAIWYLEEEITSVSDQALTWVTEARNAVLTPGGWSGLGNVRVLNITTLAGAQAQSQLFMVPLPPAIGVGLAGLSGLVLLHRRRRTRGRVTTHS